MKFKRSVLLISIICFSLFSTGCGEALITMSDEEEAIVTLYAAKMVSKFNENQTNGICNARIRDGELDDAYAAAGVSTEDETSNSEDVSESADNADEATNQGTDTSLDPDMEDTTGETADAIDGENLSSDTGYSFTDAIGIDGMEFTCSEFDVSTEFKASSSFVLSEVSGKKYVVLTIEGTNTSDSTIDFSALDSRSYSLSINDGTASQSQYTPLSNDLSTYDGKLAAGDSKTFILVFLFSDSSVENITSLELYVEGDGSTRGTTI